MAIKQLSDGNPEGTSLGQSASDLVSLYGKTPVVQAAAITTKASVLASLKSGLNAVIVALRGVGIIASS